MDESQKNIKKILETFLTQDFPCIEYTL